MSDQQAKITSTVNSQELLQKRVDSELKNITEMTKDSHKEDNKGIDEGKFNLRMERLGKEISLVKSKQAEQTQQYDNSALRQTSIEQQTTGILKTLEKQQKEVLKISNIEHSIKKLDSKVDTMGANIDKSINETHQKVEKNELDELKNGIEKERSKINYFQDKISNVAKSVDGVKIEVNNMSKLKIFNDKNKYFFPGDKFCADIESHDETLKSLSLNLVDNQKSISENTSALKGVTMESIGKVKEMAANCMQVETNIRSIRDKSILFDNDIKQIKDQLVHLKRDKSKTRPTTSDAEIQKLMKTKDEELKSLNETVKELKRKLHSTSLELNNIKEDKRTKDCENEERQISLEQNLSDVRGWVEAMLNESNKQLRGIADEVENANVKISKCASDLSEVFVQHASSTGDVSLVKKTLEDQIKEVKDYGNIQQRELLDKVGVVGKINSSLFSKC